jgi:hypothetical protein
MMIMRSSIRVALLLSGLILSTRSVEAEEQGGAPVGTGLHAGVGLSIHQPIISDETDLVPELELGAIIRGVVDLYLDLGLDIERETFEDDNREVKSTAGALMPELGARFIIGTPRPGGAFFYVGLALTPVIGIASYESDEEGVDEEQYEDRAREHADRFDIGLLMGVEYLIARSFGISAEAGFVMSINNLKKADPEEPDKHMRLGFFVPFSIRAAYHF